MNSPRKGQVHTLKSRLRQFSVEAILDAAEAVLAEEGLDARMEAIAARAGVAVGTLYNHFKDRDALVDALFDVRRAATIARVTAALEAAKAAPFRERLVIALRAMLDSPDRHSSFKKMLFRSDHFRRRRPSSKAAQEMVALLAPLVEQGQREKILRPDPRGLQPAFLLGTVHTALSLAFDEPSRLSMEQAPEIIAQQFIDGAGRR